MSKKLYLEDVIKLLEKITDVSNVPLHIQTMNIGAENRKSFEIYLHICTEDQKI